MTAPEPVQGPRPVPPVPEDWQGSPTQWSNAWLAAEARRMAADRVAAVNAYVAAELSAAGHDVQVIGPAEPQSQAVVEAVAALEKSQTVRAAYLTTEVTCQRCGHGYSSHWADTTECAQVMRDGADCACPGFAWVDPEGPAESYGQQQ